VREECVMGCIIAITCSEFHKRRVKGWTLLVYHHRLICARPWTFEHVWASVRCMRASERRVVERMRTHKRYSIQLLL
jgi:hypothetical protein